MAKSDKSRSSRPSRRFRRWVLGAIATASLGTASFIAWVLLNPSNDPFRRHHARVARDLLDSPEAEHRKRGAWYIAENRAADTAQLLLARHLAERREADPDVRESFVYALGRVGDPLHFPLLRTLAVSGTERSGYVRAAAWLAAARVDRARFRNLAEAQPSADDDWDRIGLAQAWLAIGDCRGVMALLEFAGRGDHGQRVVAARALTRGVCPALVAVGRWPIDAELRAGEVWPEELVAEVRRRCGELDLQAIADESRPHIEQARAVQRIVRRLHGARERLVGLLFSSE